MCVFKLPAAPPQAAALAQAGANLLAQNFRLEIAGARLSRAQLGRWVWLRAQGRETVLLLQRKKVPPAVEKLILQHVVQLHLARRRRPPSIPRDLPPP